MVETAAQNKFDSMSSFMGKYYFGQMYLPSVDVFDVWSNI